MRLRAGTSGYSYAAWKGSFYPEKLPAKEMLSYYAARFSTVEINGSFYRLPSVSTLKDWAASVPPDFLFSLKAPGAITHRKWSDATAGAVREFLSATSALGNRLGPLLFQFPPYLKKDLLLISNLINVTGAQTSIAVEFRHPSWFDDATFGLLRKNKIPLVYNDDDVKKMPFVGTAKWGYLRLRRTEYADRQLHDVLRQSEKQNWREVFVYFKHEDKATAPALVRRLTAL
jgi:uncharacterized protein YecE (DUF72 family)